MIKLDIYLIKCRVFLREHLFYAVDLISSDRQSRSGKCFREGIKFLVLYESRIRRSDITFREFAQAISSQAYFEVYLVIIGVNGHCAQALNMSDQWTRFDDLIELFLGVFGNWRPGK